MSNTVMALCWWLDLAPTEKAVLIALADAADDNGLTWIAVRSRKSHKLDLIRKTGFSERTIQGAIGRLVDGGHMTRDERPGKGVFTTIHPNGQSAKEWAQAAAAGPPQQMRGARNAPPQQRAETPAPDAGKPSETIKLGESRPRASRADILGLGVSEQQWSDFEAMRKAKRSPLTAGALDLAHSRLAKLARDGHPPGDVVEQSTLRGWTGLFELRSDFNDHHRTDHNSGEASNPMVGAAANALRRGADRPPPGRD